MGPLAPRSRRARGRRRVWQARNIIDSTRRSTAQTASRHRARRDLHATGGTVARRRTGDLVGDAGARGGRRDRAGALVFGDRRGVLRAPRLYANRAPTDHSCASRDQIPPRRADDAWSEAGEERDPRTLPRWVPRARSLPVSPRPRRDLIHYAITKQRLWPVSDRPARGKCSFSSRRKAHRQSPTS